MEDLPIPAKRTFETRRRLPREKCIELFLLYFQEMDVSCSVVGNDNNQIMNMKIIDRQ
jgi:hypothetical protein